LGFLVAVSTDDTGLLGKSLSAGERIVKIVANVLLAPNQTWKGHSYLYYRNAESQNGRGWKGPMWVI